MGDFRDGSTDFVWGHFDEKIKPSKRAIGRNNGCAAMLSILGFMAHEEIATLNYESDLTGGAIAHIVISGVTDFELL